MAIKTSEVFNLRKEVSDLKQSRIKLKLLVCALKWIIFSISSPLNVPIRCVRSCRKRPKGRRKVQKKPDDFANSAPSRSGKLAETSARYWWYRNDRKYLCRQICCLRVLVRYKQREYTEAGIPSSVPKTGQRQTGAATEIEHTWGASPLIWLRFEV